MPLAVWPVAQTSPQYQRTGRYLPASFQHPGKMVPELARRIVKTYSRPGDMVVDPMCGIGTTVVEAAALGRRCIGIELEPRWAELATANLDAILPEPERPFGEVRIGDALQLESLIAKHAGKVDLVATSPPYACEVGTTDKSAWFAGRSLCDRRTLNYSDDRTNLGHLRDEAYLDAMVKVYVACRNLLRPGGVMVTVTKNLRPKGRCFDLAAATVRVAQQAGFRYQQHVIAVLARIKDSDLVARPFFWQLNQIRKELARGW